MDMLWRTCKRSYPGAQEFVRRVQELSKSLALDLTQTNQFLVFRGVRQKDLNEIDTIRPSISRLVRLCWIEELQVLIVRCVSHPHDTAAMNFSSLLTAALARMGTPDLALSNIGAGMVITSRWAKEPDQQYRPHSRRAADKWLTVVVEVGFSEPLSQSRSGVPISTWKRKDLLAFIVICNKMPL